MCSAKGSKCSRQHILRSLQQSSKASSSSRVCMLSGFISSWYQVAEHRIVRLPVDWKRWAGHDAWTDSRTMWIAAFHGHMTQSNQPGGALWTQISAGLTCPHFLGCRQRRAFLVGNFLLLWTIHTSSLLSDIGWNPRLFLKGYNEVTLWSPGIADFMA